MKRELEDALRARWPGIFADLYGDPEQTGLAYGLACGDGWYQLIDLTCGALQREADIYDGPQPVATQVKEKLGTMRFRIKQPSERQRAVLAFAQDLSTAICEKCGELQCRCEATSAPPLQPRASSTCTSKVPGR